LILRLHRQVGVVDFPEGLLLQWRFGRVLFRNPTPALRATVEQLRGPGLPDTAELPPELDEAALLCAAAGPAAAPLATLEPVSRYFRLAWAPLDAGLPYMLSRFAYTRRLGTALALESPLAHARVTLHAWRAVAVAGALACPHRWRDLQVPGLDAHEAEALFVLLLAAGMLTRAGQPEPASLACWEFHDLLFHARSRMGRHDGGIGVTGRLRDVVPPPPATKPLPTTDPIPIPHPPGDLGSGPVNLPRLGRFLERVAPAKSPELEIYAFTADCEGLPAGLYYHDAGGHRLYRVADRTADADRLVLGTQEGGQVVVIAAARFALVGWRQESMAYAQILKDAGALLFAMQQVADDMGLPGHAAGSGDADLFATLAGTDYYAESSVGEFILG